MVCDIICNSAIMVYNTFCSNFAYISCYIYCIIISIGPIYYSMSVVMNQLGIIADIINPDSTKKHRVTTTRGKNAKEMCSSMYGRRLLILRSISIILRTRMACCESQFGTDGIDTSRGEQRCQST